eukprot:g34552.t1
MEGRNKTHTEYQRIVLRFFFISYSFCGPLLILPIFQLSINGGAAYPNTTQHDSNPLLVSIEAKTIESRGNTIDDHTRLPFAAILSFKVKNDKCIIIFCFLA